MNDIHSCSYYCSRPECVLAQRDELRDKLFAATREPLLFDPVAWRWKSPNSGAWRLQGPD
jgi:hypothetical protein